MKPKTFRHKGHVIRIYDVRPTEAVIFLEKDGSLIVTMSLTHQSTTDLSSFAREMVELLAK